VASVFTQHVHSHFPGRSSGKLDVIDTEARGGYTMLDFSDFKVILKRLPVVYVVVWHNLNEAAFPDHGWKPGKTYTHFQIINLYKHVMTNITEDEVVIYTMA
jgi:hypothetical protein